MLLVTRLHSPLCALASHSNLFDNPFNIARNEFIEPTLICKTVAKIWSHNNEARRNLKLPPLAVLTTMLLASCGFDKTRYEIQYTFDNTTMRSDFLEVYELTSDGINGKWSSTYHHVDTVVTGGDTVEWVSGRITDVAREDCIALQVYTSGYRPGGGGNYTLDTVFPLTPGGKNYIYIHPGLTWLPTYGE